MSARNWFRTHRIQVVTHAAIVGAFVLLVVFMAEPLFGRLEKITGEAQLQQLELPTETGGVRYAVDSVLTGADNVLEISGWAFIEGRDMQLDACATYIVLESRSSTYVFDTIPRRRGDVTWYFKELGLNLDWAGFHSVIPLRRIPGGEYTIGILIRKGDVEALVYTHRTVDR